MQVIHKSNFWKATNLSYISRSVKLRLVGKTASILLGLLLFAIVSPVYIKLDTSMAADYGGEPGSGGSSTPGTANPSTTTISLTLTNDTLALDLAPTSTAGTFAASSPANFTVTTNNVTGYTLSIKSSVTDPTDSTETTNASRLVNTEDSTKYISSISGSVTESVFSNASNTQYNNMWGYLPSKLNSSTNTNYLASPDYATATILNTTACANGTLNSACTNASDSYSITLGARVDGTLPTGTYNHAFTLIAVGNPINYSITYYANDGANGANTTNMPSPNPQTGNAANDVTSITLSSTKPKRTGYELRGWCTVQPTQDTNYPNDQVCTGGTIYQPGASFGIDQTTVNVVDLYATWWEPNLIKLGAMNATMQDMSPTACYNSTINDTATLTDNRDGTTKSYTVAKLADGLCWMTTNLNLGADHEITLTPNDTDTTSNFTLPAINTANTNKLRDTNANDTNANGTYYSWNIAVANGNNTNFYNGRPSNSICPKNWDLPAVEQWNTLNYKAAYSSSNPTTNNPSSFLINGGYASSTTFYQTSYSYYWSTNSSTSTTAYGARVNASILETSNQDNSAYGGNKNNLKNIRCIADNGSVTIIYDGNGSTDYPVTGSVSPQENARINYDRSKDNGFTRTGWHFNGWNTEPDGTGIAISSGGQLYALGPTIGTITLYARWRPEYTITYINNCYTFNTGCTESTSNTTSSQTIALANTPSTGTETGTLGAYNKFSQTNYKIKSWNTAADGSGTDYPVSSTYTIPAGSDPGDGVTLYAQWVPVYTVQYDGNGADNASTGMGVANATTGIKGVRHYNVGEGDTFDLFASNFKRVGYGFVGWSTDSSAWDHLTDNDNTNDPKIWGPNEVFTAPAYNGSSILTLYAIWAPAEKDGNNNPVYLQGWTGCSAMTATTYNSSNGTLTVARDSVTALTDKRDNMVYAVAKLADGNCWMIENLRLDTAGTIGQNTNDNSVTNESLSQGYGGVFHGLANPERNISTQNTIQNTLYTTASDVTGKYQITIDSSYSSYIWTLFPRYNDTNTTWNNNTSSATTPTLEQEVTSSYAHQDYDNYVYSYGNYYTWAAAMASTIYYQGYSVTNAWPSGSDAANTSLCPTGWKLPLGVYRNSVDKSFSHLDYVMGGSGNSSSINSATSATNSIEWRKFPNNIIYSGIWWTTLANHRGSYGYYWSSSANTSIFVHGLTIYSSSVSPGTTGINKSYGYSIRCIADS